MQLRGSGPDGVTDPAWPGQRVLDLWHVVVPGTRAGSLLVASWDLDGTDDQLAARDTLVDSMRIQAD